MILGTILYGTRFLKMRFGQFRKKQFLQANSDNIRVVFQLLAILIRRP
jgi:hypothetical protein